MFINFLSKNEVLVCVPGDNFFTIESKDLKVHLSVLNFLLNLINIQYEIGIGKTPGRF